MELSEKGNNLTKTQQEDGGVAGFPYVSKYKYLGIYWNRNLSINPHLEHLK